MNTKKIFFRIGIQRLSIFGYECIEVPEFQGIRKYFFRKDLGNQLFSFISLHQYSHVNIIINNEQVPRRFDLEMWRNLGELPREGNNPNKTLDNWLYLSLPALLWYVIKQPIYDGPNHVWEYHNEDELIVQLNDAFDKMIEFGIPWVEDPKSKNPY